MTTPQPTTPLDLLAHFTLTYRKAWDARAPWALTLNDGGLLAHREFQQWAAGQGELPERAAQLAQDYFLLTDEDRMVFVLDAMTHLPADAPLWAGIFGPAHAQAAWDLLGEPASKPKTALILPPGFTQSLEDELRRPVELPSGPVDLAEASPDFVFQRRVEGPAGEAALYSAGLDGELWVFDSREYTGLTYLHLEYDALPPGAMYRIDIFRAFGPVTLANPWGFVDPEELPGFVGRDYDGRLKHLEHLVRLLLHGELDLTAPRPERLLEASSTLPFDEGRFQGRAPDTTGGDYREWSREEIAAAYNRMLGSFWTVLNVGPAWTLGTVQELFVYAQQQNNQRARAARPAGQPWRKLKVILWRGCWAMCERDTRGRLVLSSQTTYSRTEIRVAHVDHGKTPLVAAIGADRAVNGEQRSYQPAKQLPFGPLSKPPPQQQGKRPRPNERKRKRAARRAQRRNS